MIKKITITAVALRKAKKDGTPYTYKSKKDNNTYPRTLVSIKDENDVWYMGWSYKDGSQAESVQKGQTLELFITEDGDFKNWRFVKDDDRKDAEMEELKRKLAEFEAQGGPSPVATPAPAAKKTAKKKVDDTGNINYGDENVNVDDIPF